MIDQWGQSFWPAQAELTVEAGGCWKEVDGLILELARMATVLSPDPICEG